MQDSGGGGGWGDGPTNFEQFSHEALKSMIDGARPAELTTSGQALLDAKETLETVTTALETRISRLEWTGTSADNFRDWAGKVMVATRKFAEHSGQVGKAMNHAGGELSFALLSMPPVPANAKLIVDSNGDKRLMCKPGDSSDKKVLVANAKTELETARQEAIRRMESLSSTYNVTTETLAKSPAVQFPPLPALPAGSSSDGGGPLSGGGRTTSRSSVHTGSGDGGGTLNPGNGPSNHGGGANYAYDVSSSSRHDGGSVGGVAGGGTGGYVPPQGTGLLGNGPLQGGSTPVLPVTGGPPGGLPPTGPGPVGGGPAGLPPIGGFPVGFPPGGRTGGVPPVGKGNGPKLSANPPFGGRPNNAPANPEGLSGGRPFQRPPGGGHAGGEHTAPGGRAGVRGGGAGGRRFTGQAGGVVGGTPRTPGSAGQFSSGGSGLAGRPNAGAGSQVGAGRGAGMRGGAGGAGTGGEHDERNRRQRADYLHEDEETWVGDRDTAPPVVD
ncbi:WXG100 family type VII secretion target [Embleya sp. AB8]|uniref:WXG100 family type VII secretion target n=1 Tax=Embleya sp. AB8 TaxID=3156304 RepID=UPI003C75E0FE